MSDLTCRRWGMTMRTPAGPVDLVPLQRRLDGEPAEVNSDERAAAVLALTHLGYRVDQIAAALNLHADRTRATLAKFGIPEVAAAEAISWTAVAYTSAAQRRARRREERVEVDGRLVHPDAPHGTDLAYTDYVCRCVPCTSAHAAALACRRKAVAHAAA